ncbi:MAG: hypothetical protein M1822_002500 [Bathelium mastoideum]|nr:MAG: hypothetical protein M1822_002500 [Bathelium mastoideum]
MQHKQQLMETLSTFINGNHILAHHGIVDGFGHVSVRNPHDSSTFFTSVGLPPALVTSLDSIGEYTVEGAIPVINGSPDPSHKQSPFSERYIHASLLARFPSIHAVVHSHSPTVVAFSVSDVPLKPVWHMAGFLDVDGVKVWDIAEAYRDAPAAGQKQYLLVNNQTLGDSLAAAFSAPSAHADAAAADAGDRALRRHVVLQRGHGFAVVGKSLQEAVYRAIYTQENAKVQRDALREGRTSDDSIRYLPYEEARDCAEMAEGAVNKVWPLWVKEASMSALYQNQLGPDGQ